MSKISINLGKESDLKILFSYPNVYGAGESLDETILHWLGQTLERDGLEKNMASINKSKEEYTLVLDGALESENEQYESRIKGILKAGLAAYKGPINEIQSRKTWCSDDIVRSLWDPLDTQQWRFFLTLGVGMVNHRSLQFFHYPPIRLLDPLRDSMEDPVTYRCRDLLMANGIDEKETKYYETRINSTPIAAPDDQGTNSSPAADPTLGGLIPIGYFKKFEKDMISTLVKPHPIKKGFTIPMTAYGREPRQQFSGLSLGPCAAALLSFVDGLKTPALGSNHPFNFYYTAQQSDGKGQVGSGIMLPGTEKRCTQLQIEDLSVVRWQVEMAKDPSQDPWQVINDAKIFWKAPEQARLVQALVIRHASLTYDTPEGLKFGFALTLEEAFEKVDRE